MHQIKQQSNENIVQETLTRWLESNGAKVYWGESPPKYNHKTFEVKSEAIDSWGRIITSTRFVSVIR